MTSTRIAVSFNTLLSIIDYEGVSANVLMLQMTSMHISISLPVGRGTTHQILHIYINQFDEVFARPNNVAQPCSVTMQYKDINTRGNRHVRRELRNILKLITTSTCVP